MPKTGSGQPITPAIRGQSVDRTLRTTNYGPSEKGPIRERLMNGICKGVRIVGYFDCVGGGQVVVRNNVAYVGHIAPPNGTSIIDVSDPAKPRWLAQINIPAGTLSHKVRVENGIMLVNREIFPIGRQDPDFRGGLEVFDVTRPDNPKRISAFSCRGMHRFTFDGRYVYGSPEMDGFLGNIVGIIDFLNPEKPELVGKWWMPGQWSAGGETPTWKGTDHRCHHPIRLGNRLYASYWHGGFVILNIDDMSKPTFVSGLDWSPPFPWPTHTALPVPFPLRGRRVMLVADEDVVRIEPASASFLWLVDITDETRPVPFASYQVEEEDGSFGQDYSGMHQPCEEIRGTEIPIAWFSRGMRIVDIANPHAPKEVASFMPPVPEGATRVQSNDVCYDDRGLIYLIDRTRGLHILERI